MFCLLKKIISDENKLKRKSKSVYNNFQYNEKKFQNLISQIRNTKCIINKVFLISNLNLKNKKRLFYSFFNKLNKNLKNNFDSINLSDRDFIRENRNILDPTGRREFNNEIINRVKLHNPDLIILGHTDRIDINTFKKIRSLNYKCKIIKIFIDSISDEFFDFKKVFYDYLYLDNIFISSNTEKLKKYDIFNKIKFIPYPVDTKIDYLKSFRNNYKKTDVFFALSHGQNRGVLKSGKKDEREDFLKEFLKKSNRKFNCKIVGINRVQPVWGKKFYNEIYNSKICLNLSRGHYKKHYSSDRIATLIGNGCFVLNEYKNLYKDFFDKNELIHFKNTKDLIQKINYYLKRPKLMNRIAKKSYIKYHKYFSTKTVINFIIDCVNKNLTKKKYIWY